jgi:hypothetical protein
LGGGNRSSFRLVQIHMHCGVKARAVATKDIPLSTSALNDLSRTTVTVSSELSPSARG